MYREAFKAPSTFLYGPQECQPAGCNAKWSIQLAGALTSHKFAGNLIDSNLEGKQRGMLSFGILTIKGHNRAGFVTVEPPSQFYRHMLVHRKECTDCMA